MDLAFVLLAPQVLLGSWSCDTRLIKRVVSALETKDASYIHDTARYYPLFLLADIRDLCQKSENGIPFSSNRKSYANRA